MNVYSKEDRFSLVDSEAMTPEEEGFMLGYLEE